MRFTTLVAIASLAIPFSPCLTSAQSSDATLTFNVPLDLKQVSSDISKVAVYCRITSSAIISGRSSSTAQQQEIPVTGGQVVTTVTIVVTLTGLDNPAGKAASYDCSLTGYSTSLQRWDRFDQTQPAPVFRLTPTPMPLTGNFVW